MLMSMAVVFFGMQLMMVGPMKGRLEGIQAQLDSADGKINNLVGASDTASDTASMLSSLHNMESELDSLARLRQKIEMEVASSNEALTSLDRIAAVQQKIIASRQQTTVALAEIESLETLRDEVVSGSSQTDVADNTLTGMLALQRRVIAASNGLEQANERVADMSDLTNSLIANADTLKVASQRFDDFLSLQNRIIASNDSLNEAVAHLDSAEANIAKLDGLKKQVLASADGLDAASENSRTLVALSTTLGSTLNLGPAKKNLNDMVRLQNTLGEQTQQVAAAVQNLELIDQFQTEVASHFRSMDGLRRNLMDLAMLEPSVNKVARVLQPLTDISSLRRLDDNEVREAARVILDRRTSRLSKANLNSDDSGNFAAEDSDADLVPLPPNKNKESTVH